MLWSGVSSFFPLLLRAPQHLLWPRFQPCFLFFLFVFLRGVPRQSVALLCCGRVSPRYFPPLLRALSTCCGRVSSLVSFFLRGVPRQSVAAIARSGSTTTCCGVPPVWFFFFLRCCGEVSEAAGVQLTLRGRLFPLKVSRCVCFRVSVRAQFYLSQVISFCSDLGPDCTRSFAAWTLHFLCAGKHICTSTIPSHSLFCLFLTPVWNHLCCWLVTASGTTRSVCAADRQDWCRVWRLCRRLALQSHSFCSSFLCFSRL